MISPSEIISYIDMCKEEGVNLQRGMNFRLRGGPSVVLMSLRHGAPYSDRVEEEGRVLVYEGHDVPRSRGNAEPKKLDQPARNPGGGPTQNGLFYEAALKYKRGSADSELVKVYEKIRPGIWVYNGLFKLVDAWQETIASRKVFKFRLEFAEGSNTAREIDSQNVDHQRLIPTSVKLEVWKRDKGMCVVCGSRDNLHFDHIIPYSKGGSSLSSKNVQLLCVRHNLAKKDRIE